MTMSAMMRRVTYWIVMGVMGAVMCVLVLVFLYCVVPAQERRAAARGQLDEDPHDAAVRDALWHATKQLEECPHDDVLEDWSPRLRGWDETVYGAPRSTVVDQGASAGGAVRALSGTADPRLGPSDARSCGVTRRQFARRPRRSRGHQTATYLPGSQRSDTNSVRGAMRDAPTRMALRQFRSVWP
jgi:hypothetical protein